MSTLIQKMYGAVFAYLNNAKKLKDEDIFMRMTLKKKGLTLSVDSLLGFFKPLTDPGIERGISLLNKLSEIECSNLPEPEIRIYFFNYAMQQLSKGSLFGSKRLRLAVLESIARDLKIGESILEQYGHYVSACAFVKAQPDSYESILIAAIETQLKQKPRTTENYVYLQDSMDLESFKVACAVS